MFKFNHATLVFISGLVWLIIGCILLPLGLNFIVESLLKENLATQNHPVLDFFNSFAGGMEPAALIWIACALGIGFMKGKFVFKKSVDRGVKHILSLPSPSSLLAIYSLSYVLLIASMFILGYLVRLLPLDVRGGVDVVIGAALINGAMFYFKEAWAIRQSVKVPVRKDECCHRPKE